MKQYRFFVVLWFCCIAASAAVGQTDSTHLDVFSNVQISKQSGDCDGLSIKLSRKNRASASSVISGVLYAATGSCPGTKYSIEESKVDPKIRSLSFVAKEFRTGKLVAKFDGFMDAKGVHGKFGYANQKTGDIDSWSEIELHRIDTNDWARIGE